MLDTKQFENIKEELKQSEQELQSVASDFALKHKMLKNKQKELKHNEEAAEKRYK